MLRAVSEKDRTQSSHTKGGREIWRPFSSISQKLNKGKSKRKKADPTTSFG